ncbi:MAG: hypothetical protein Kow00124_11320 [Anaerolineae bacterium]
MDNLLKHNRLVGGALALLGLALTLISLLADVIGVGAYPASIGWKQFSGMAAGMILVVIGVFIYLGSMRPQPPGPR